MCNSFLSTGSRAAREGFSGVETLFAEAVEERDGRTDRSMARRGAAPIEVLVDRGIAMALEASRIEDVVPPV
jgi:hypothetical protein